LQKWGAAQVEMLAAFLSCPSFLTCKS